MEMEEKNPLDLLPMTRTRYKAVLIAGTSWLFDYMNLMSISLTLTVLITLFALNTQKITIILDSEYIGMLIGNIILGRIADYAGRRNALMITMGLLAIGAFGSALSYNYVSLAVTRFIGGLGIGSDIVLASIYISEFVKPRDRGKYVSFGAALGAVGYMIVAGIAFFVIPIYGFRPVFVIVGIAATIGILLRFIMPESPRWLAEHGQKEKANNILKTIEKEAYAKNKGIPKREEAMSLSLPEKKRSFGESVILLLSPKYRRRTSVLWVDWFIYIFAFYAFESWIPVFLITVFHVTLVKTLLYSFIIYTANVPGYLSGGFLADKIGRKLTTIVGFLLVILFGLIFGYSHGNVIPLLVGAVGVAFFLEVLGSTLNIYAAELYPTSTRGVGAGVAQSWARFGAVLSAPFVMFLALGGVTSVVTGLAILIFVAVVVTAILGEESKGQVLETLSPEVAVRDDNTEDKNKVII